MRGLTTRSVRPCLRQGRSSFSAPPIRRTTFPPLQRPFTYGDAFLFLLPSVLAAALVIDTTGKERRRAEWDRQIAQAQEETEKLRQRQLDAWSRIQCRSVSHGAWQQRRTLFTASRSTKFIDDERERDMDPLHRELEINEADEDAEYPHQEITEEHQEINQRFGRLIATRLALQMMLHLRSGRARLHRANEKIDANSALFKHSLDYVVQELDKVNSLIDGIDLDSLPWNIPMNDEFHERQEQMQERIMEMTAQYRAMEMHLPDLVMRYVQLISEFKMGLPMGSYVELMRSLAWHHYESPLALFVEEAICDGHEYLDSYTISNILFRQGRAYDSVNMNRFLHRLTRSDYIPKARSVWYRAHVNDQDVALPKSKNGHLITALIRTCLTNRQQTVAEAYATVFIDRDRIDEYSGVHKWFVVGNFLFAYGQWGSWNSGRRWLQTAVMWAEDLVQAGGWAMGRVVLRMLDFCVACGKKEEYEMVMEAAIAASIPVPPINPDKPVKVTDRVISVRQDWLDRTKHIRVYRFEEEPDISPHQVRIFQSKLDNKFDTEQSNSEKAFHPMDSDWSEEATVGWNPLTAARRLAEVSAHRQRTVNTGFKHLEPGPIEFPLRKNSSKETPPKSISSSAGPHNSMSQEPLDEEFITSFEGNSFTSPFFSHAQEEQRSSSSQSAIQDNPNNPFVREIEQLRNELSEAKQEIQELDESKTREILHLSTQLRRAIARIQQLRGANYTAELSRKDTTPSQADVPVISNLSANHSNENDEPVKASAAG